MAIEKVDIEKFLGLAKHFPVLDVRSPGEYNHAHIPNAFSFPLFTDEERKVVGITYKQQSREAAIKVGLDFFGVKMKTTVEEAEKIIGKRQEAIGNGQQAIDNRQLAMSKGCILIHCWRGGMRSAGVAWLLDLYGFKVYTLIGGYKAFRNWVLKQFEKPYDLKIVGGYTGSGKTYILKELQNSNEQVIDLEDLANHKGSAFGALGQKPQPTQEMFENFLASGLSATDQTKNIWLEDESQRIGTVMIPNNFWDNMRRSPVYFFDIPFKQRLAHIVEDYGVFEKEKLVASIMKIQKRLGGLETKNAINYLLENNVEECFRILLSYYDKLYAKGLYNRENLQSLLNVIACESVDPVDNAKKLSQEEVTARPELHS